MLSAVIAVTTYENPTIVEAVLHIGAKAVLPSPVRSVGLLSSLVVARQIHDDLKAQAKRLQKLESKLLGARRIEEAKGILMRTRHISEAAAYDLIREQAMSKRVTTEDIAAAIVKRDASGNFSAGTITVREKGARKSYTLTAAEVCEYIVRRSLGLSK